MNFFQPTFRYLFFVVRDSQTFWVFIFKILFYLLETRTLLWRGTLGAREREKETWEGELSPYYHSSRFLCVFFFVSKSYTFSPFTNFSHGKFTGGNSHGKFPLLAVLEGHFWRTGFSILEVIGDWIVLGELISLRSHN